MAAGCGSGGREEPADHLLLITLDTTRADRLGCYGRRDAGTGWLDSLAEAGTRVERAYAQTPITLPSHLSILTGVHPPRTGVHVNGQTEMHPGIRTLPEILSEKGFYTVAAVGGFPLASRYPVRRGFQRYDDTMVDPRNPEGVERDAGLVVRAAARLLDHHDGRRTFLWVHLFDPHDPYEPPSPFLERFPGDPYQGEIARMDAALADLMRDVEAVLPRGDLAVCVVGDHGEALGEHGEPTHGFFLYEGTVRVPLILSGPRVPSGKVLEETVQTVDLVPTLLDLLDIPVPDGLDGRIVDLEGSREESSLDPVYLETEIPERNYGWSPLRGVVDGRLKYILAPREELYDLAADPGERTNLAAEMPEEAERLRRWVETLQEGPGEAGEADTDPRLAALGYIGSGAPTGGPGVSLDPKDHVDTYARFVAASGALERGEPLVALSYLDELLREQDAPGARFKRAMALRMAGRLDEASVELDRVAESDPEFAGAALERTRIAAARRDPQETLLWAERHLERFPDHPVAILFRGAAREMLGDAAAAAADYRRALEINPGYRNASLRLAALLVRAGRPDRARPVLERHLVLHPGDELALGLLGSLQ
jgi:arylsulfatase A-like enzyme